MELCVGLCARLCLGSGAIVLFCLSNVIVGFRLGVDASRSSSDCVLMRDSISSLSLCSRRRHLATRPWSDKTMRRHTIGGNVSPDLDYFVGALWQIGNRVARYVAA